MQYNSRVRDAPRRILGRKAFFLEDTWTQHVIHTSISYKHSIEFLVLWSFYKVVVVFWSFQSFHSFLSRTSLINDGFNVRAKKEDDEDEDNDFFFSLGGGGVMHEMRGKATKMQGGGAGGFIRLFIYVLALHYTGLFLIWFAAYFFMTFTCEGSIYTSYELGHTPHPNQPNAQTHQLIITTISLLHLENLRKILETSCLHLFFFFVSVLFPSFFLPFGYFLLSSFL